MTDIDLATIPYYTFKVGTFASEENVIISNTGYTGAGGFELYFYPSAADSIWKAIFEAGEEYGIKPIGLGAVIRSGWKWASVCMVMIWMIRLLR